MLSSEHQVPVKRAIITGGNGFVGSAVIQALVHAGVEVHALVNDNYQRLTKLLPASNIHIIRDTPQEAVEVVLRVRPDALFHLASVYSEPDDVNGVTRMLSANVVLGACLLYGCTHLEPRPVFINTGTYWQRNSGGDYDPNTLYAATKQSFQDLVAFYHRKLGVRSLTLAIYDTFGEEDDRGKLWQRITEARPGTHFALSSGLQEIYLVHIEDTVSAFLTAAELLRSQEPVEEVYAVRPDQPVVLKTFVEELVRRSNTRLGLGWGELAFWSGQIEVPWRGPILPGWQPKRDPMEGLTSMIRARNSGKLSA